MDDVAAAQRQLNLIARGQLFPSLATLDTLNLLPYYVHVWCYTYDPLPAKGAKRQRGFDGCGVKGTTSSSGGGGGGGGGGGLAGMMSGGGHNISGAFTQTYLQRYETTGYAGGGGGDASSGGSAPSSQQLLRGLMLDGARTLWRGVKSTAQRGVRDALARADRKSVV